MGMTLTESATSETFSVTVLCALSVEWKWRTATGKVLDNIVWYSFNSNVVY
jgi:hypothetical protein